MPKALFAEPESHVPVVRNGMVFVEFRCGDETFTVCTTIHGYRVAIERGRELLRKFEEEQAAVASVGGGGI